MSIEPLTIGHFRPHLHRVFRVAGGRLDLTLTQVDAPRLAPDNARLPREPFTLIFCGPPGDVLPEGLHTLEVESGLSFALYLIPIHTAAADRQDYQAVFN